MGDVATFSTFIEFVLIRICRSEWEMGRVERMGG